MLRRIFVTVALIAVLLISTSFLKFNPYYIIIDKSDYALSVYDQKGWLVTYPVVFGNKDLGDKFMEGDRRTPEGNFYIINKRVHEKWHKFMMLDYPNQQSIIKFNQRKASGVIPANAKIGGGIGIHGTWPREDFAVDSYQNWTWGCISMRNGDVDELFNLVPVGTMVTIRR